MALELRAAGYPQHAIAFVIGTSQVSVSRQLAKAEAGKAEAQVGD
jgi:predicted transcriptional regulator